MPERRLIYMLGAVVALLLVMIVLDMVADARAPATPLTPAALDASPDSQPSAESSTRAGSAQPASAAAPPVDRGPGYLEQLARADARFSLAIKAEGGRVELTRDLHLPIQRVTPTDYAAFSGFCRGVDLAEASELAVALP